MTVVLQQVDGLWKMSDVLCEVEETQLEGWQVLADETYGFQMRYPENWTYDEAQLLPLEERPDAEKALTRLLFFQPEGWDGVALPLHVQITEGTEEEFGRLHVPVTSIEDIEIQGRVVVRAIEDMVGVQVVRYIFQDPTNEDVRVVALDYISGFPDRAAGQSQVIDLLQHVLSTFEFVR